MIRLFPILLFCLLSRAVFSQAPTAEFSGSPLSVCIGSAISFSDQSVQGASPITTWTWDFGDGNSSTTTNPSHTYGAPGTYTVTLVATAQNGQSDAEVKVDYVTIHPLPDANFTTTGNGCTVPFNVAFTNNSSTGPDITYSWSFGNGQTSTLENPAAVTYSAAGTYPVNLTVTNTTTGCTNSFSQDMVVSDYSAGMNIPAEACVGETITFQDASTVGTDFWNWVFGDGFGGQSQNPTHTYTAPGTYTVTLATQNTTSGCSGNATQTIIIHDAPTPSFTSDVTTGCAPLSVNFTNTSPAGTNFDWDFGNGNTFNGQNPPAQSYLNDGGYDVTLTMTDANGCVGSTTIANMINVSAPIVQFSMDTYNGCEPVVVQFTDASTAPDPVNDPLVTWLWDFGDGSSVFSGQTPPPHSYNVGIYSVSLTVVTQNGCQATLTLPDTIQVGSIQNANFSVSPIVECAKSPIDFIDLTTFNGTPGQGEVVYSWDFGDGGISSQQSPTYEYPSDTGYFDVTLIVDWRGCLDTFTMSQAVYILAPVSIFTPDQTLFCNPSSLPVNLNVTDNAIHGEIPDDIEMIWKWGDGTTTFFDDPDLDDVDKGSTSHSYGNYGSYVIEQVIYNHTTGCADSTTQTIHVSQTNAGFTLSNDSTCIGSPITMTSTSTSSHAFGTFDYDMGDGGQSNGDPATYTYNSSGAFDIVLTATNVVGCSHTSSFVGLDALALPVASITPDVTTGCAPVTVTYANNSSTTGNGVPLDHFDWAYPDQSTGITASVGTSTNFTFTTEGTFQTTMIATDQFGCVSAPTTATMTITKPSAGFTLDSVVCDLESFTALNTGTGAVTHEWFVDGQSVSNATDYSGMFDETSGPGQNHVSHGVMLISTDANGCMDTMTQNIIVSLPYPAIDFTLTGASTNVSGEFTCPPVFAGFTDLTNSYGSIASWGWDFGDGKFSDLQDPDNTYVFPGTYSSTLTITDEFGCTADTALVDFLTIGGPVGFPDWTGGADVCGQMYDFDATGLSNVADIIWDLGDGNIQNSLSGFSHTYGSYDTFNPTATLIDSLGCEVLHTLPPIEIVSNGLDAFFAATPLEGPIGTTFFFDEGSVFTGSPIVSWNWDLSGDSILNITNADVSTGFGLPGTYPVTLVVTDANGCTDVYALSVIVNDEFHLPNIITPNGDGVNEFFTLPAPIFESFDIVIVNRWGNVIHSENGGSGTTLWNGKTDGDQDVTEGVYFYKLVGTLVNGEQAEKHGNITVAY